MNKRFIRTAAVVLSTLLFQSSVALAYTCAHEDHHTPGVHEIMHHLDLTKEQQEKVKVICDKAHHAIEAKDKELKDVRTLAIAAYKDGSMDEAKIEEFVKKKEHILGDMVRIKMMQRYEVGKLLTQEQKDKAAKIMEEKFKHHKCDMKCEGNCNKEHK